MDQEENGKILLLCKIIERAGRLEVSKSFFTRSYILTLIHLNFSKLVVAILGLKVKGSRNVPYNMFDD